MSPNTSTLVNFFFRHLVLTGGLPAIAFQIQRGAPVNGRDENGLTPLMLAASAGRGEVCLLLLEKGANPRAMTAGNLTASIIARDAGHPQLGAALEPDTVPASSAVMTPISEIPLEEPDDAWEAEEDFHLSASDPDIISAIREAQSHLSSAKAVPSDADWQDITIDLPAPRAGRFAELAKRILVIAQEAIEQGYSTDPAAPAILRRLSGAEFALDDLGINIRPTSFERALLDASTVPEILADPDLLETLAEGLDALRVQRPAVELYESELALLPTVDRAAEKSMFEALGEAKRRVMRILLDNLPLFADSLGPSEEVDDPEEETDSLEEAPDKPSARDLDLTSLLRSVRDRTLNVTITDLLKVDLDLDFVSMVASELRRAETSSDHADQLQAGAVRYLKVRNRVIEANLPLVMRHAQKYMRAGVEFEDLIQEGNIGLMRAVERFDITLGNRFMTYGTWWIRQACSRVSEELRRTVRVPVHVVERLDHLKSAAAELEYALGREPSVGELADEMEIPHERIVALRRLLPRPHSVETDDAGRVVRNLATSDRSDPFEVAAADDCRRQIASILNTLPPRAERILRCRFGMGEVDEHTLEEVGVQMGVTRERIRQVESKALDGLAKPGTPRNRKLRALL